MKEIYKTEMEKEEKWIIKWRIFGVSAWACAHVYYFFISYLLDFGPP